MIEFEQVRRSYGDRVAVDCLDLRVAAGELAPETGVRARER